MKNRFTKRLAIVIATLATMALAACSHHSSDNGAQATDLYVGAESVSSNVVYRGQLTRVKRLNVSSLLQQECAGDCTQFSPNAVVDFEINPNDSSQAIIVLTFIATDGEPNKVIRRNVAVEQNRRGDSLIFRSTDLSGRITGGWRLLLGSREGLIGATQLDRL